MLCDKRQVKLLFRQSGGWGENISNSKECPDRLVLPRKVVEFDLLGLLVYDAADFTLGNA